MKCYGNFKYKGLTKKDGGEFVNDRGDKIKFDASYALKLDEITADVVEERTFKVAIDSPMIAELEKLKIYDDICVEFEVQIYRNSIKLIPVRLVTNTSK